MRFIILFIFFIVGVGFFLQSDTFIPYLKWLGTLPGDLIIRKDAITLYIPLTTSFLLSLSLSILASSLGK